MSGFSYGVGLLASGTGMGMTQEQADLLAASSSGLIGQVWMTNNRAAGGTAADLTLDGTEGGKLISKLAADSVQREITISTVAVAGWTGVPVVTIMNPSAGLIVVNPPSGGSLLALKGSANSGPQTIAAYSSASIAMVGANAWIFADGDQFNVLHSNVAANLTAGYRQESSYDLGNSSAWPSYTVTLASANGNFQHFTNNYACTLNPPAHNTTIVVEMVNATGAGSVGLSGFTSTDNASALDTSVGSAFQIMCIKTNAASCAYVKKLI